MGLKGRKRENSTSMGARWFSPSMLPGTFLLESVWPAFLQHLSPVTHLCFSSPGSSPCRLSVPTTRQEVSCFTDCLGRKQYCGLVSCWMDPGIGPLPLNMLTMNSDTSSFHPPSSVLCLYHSHYCILVLQQDAGTARAGPSVPDAAQIQSDVPSSDCHVHEPYPMPELSAPRAAKAAFAEGRPHRISAEGWWCGTPGSCWEGSSLQVPGVFVARISPTVTLQLLLWCLGALGGQAQRWPSLAPAGLHTHGCKEGMKHPSLQRCLQRAPCMGSHFKQACIHHSDECRVG